FLHDVVGIGQRPGDPVGDAGQPGPLGGEDGRAVVRPWLDPLWAVDPDGRVVLHHATSCRALTAPRRTEADAAAAPAASPLDRVQSASQPRGPTQSPATNTPGSPVLSMPGRPASPPVAGVGVAPTTVIRRRNRSSSTVAGSTPPRRACSSSEARRAAAGVSSPRVR